MFEFTDSLEDSTVQQIEKKLKQQIDDNFALFNEIAPIYISLNMGRSVKPLDESTKQLEKFRLVER